MNIRERDSHRRVKKLVGTALLAATVVVLQMVSALSAGLLPFSITLALVPIVIGAALYGTGTSTFLGAVFGAVVLINCISGIDKGGHILWEVNPFFTFLTCLIKGALAGTASGLVYKAAAGKNILLGVLLAAFVSPIVNTGLFCAAMLFLFRETLEAWAGGTDIAYYIIMSLTGINFLIELATNVVISPIATRIIKIGKHM